MPAEQHSSYDRGFDLGHAEVPPTKSPVLGRTIEHKAPTGAPWKKVLAMAMVVIMVGAAFVMLVPLAKEHANAPADDTPAKMQTGEREVTYTISNIGESCVKDSRDVDGARGRHSSTPGLSEWWESRLINYSDTVAHNAYPYYVAYQSESGFNSYSAAKFPHVPFGTYGFYRYTMDAKNITTVATGSDKDPLYLPILGSGGVGMEGGTVQLNWHFTYLTTADKNSLLAGTHYANTYYGVTKDAMAPIGTVSYANDGWYVEQTGTATFDRPSAAKFLGLENPSTPLYTQFNTSNAAGALNASWWTNYKNDGQDGGPYNVVACYDYDVATGPPNCYFLMVDPSSTADNLVLRIWGYTWGMEALMMRYMDVQGLMHNWIPWPEDYYFNATITTTGANIQSRMSAVYHMVTWKDTDWWGPSLMLEAVHNDYNDMGTGWTSRFYDYIAYKSSWKPTRAQYNPGTNNFGVECGYVVTPALWNLVSGEKLTIQLPTGPHLGYIPYGNTTVDDTFPKFGGGNQEKVDEMNTYAMWGELVLGPGTLPSGLYNYTNYSAATKTLTINGPTNFAGNMNPHSGYGTLYETGVPKLMFDVAKVSTYAMTFPGGAPTVPGAYTLRVTAKNITGATVTDWNGTVNFVVTGPATLPVGQYTHTFIPTDNGVWETTLTITGMGTITVTSTDSLFTLDVTDSIAVTAIPEFPTLLMPVMIAAAMIVVFIRRRPKKDEE